jgi:HNH endonuclease
MLVSSRTVERLACSGTLSRVLLADSVVTDVGRATQAVSPATKRALRVRDRGCRFPGCDRPVNWSSPHHVEFWARGGPTKLSNLLLLCWYHHRCVHEGGWQVVKAGAGFSFVPPDRVLARRARGPGLRWAA